MRGRKITHTYINLNFFQGKVQTHQLHIHYICCIEHSIVGYEPSAGYSFSVYYLLSASLFESKNRSFSSFPFVVLYW